MGVHVVPSGDVWIWNAVAYAGSHCSTTCVMLADAPRSTWIHCGSVNCDDHRVPVFPSTAADAGVPAFSVDEAVAGLPCDSRVDAASAPVAMTTAKVAASAPSPRIPTRRGVQPGGRRGFPLA